MFSTIAHHLIIQRWSLSECGTYIQNQWLLTKLHILSSTEVLGVHHHTHLSLCGFWVSKFRCRLCSKHFTEPSSYPSELFEGYWEGALGTDHKACLCQLCIKSNPKPSSYFWDKVLLSCSVWALNVLQSPGRTWTSTFLPQPPKQLFLYMGKGRGPLGQDGFLNLKSRPSSSQPLKHGMEELGNRSWRPVRIFLSPHLFSRSHTTNLPFPLAWCQQTLVWTCFLHCCSRWPLAWWCETRQTFFYKSEARLVSLATAMAQPGLHSFWGL